MVTQAVEGNSHDEPTEFLSSVSPSPHELRRALWIVSLSLLGFLAAVPFARVPLAHSPAFIGVYQAGFVINDAITATLLFALFTLTRSAALLVLVSAYVFTAIIAVCHMLTFPGLFSPTGLLGAQLQSTAWLYMFWHGIFPLAVIIYVFVKHSPIAQNRICELSDVTAGLSAIAVASGLAIGFTTFATAGHALLPVILHDGHYTSAFIVVVSIVWILSAIGLVALWIQRPHTSLDLWLIVVMSAWVFDVALSAVFNAGRYDVGFYVGRTFGLLAASYVLVELLLETSRLYARFFRGSMQRSRDLVRASHKEVARLREQAQEKNALLASIVAASDDAIISKTLDGVITSWNAGAESMFGYAAGEAVGRHVSLIIPPDRLREEEALIEKLRRHERIDHFETVRVGKNGKQVHISLSLVPLADAEGRIVGGAKIARDITERKQSEENLKRLAQDLHDFAYTASHDLKEPLRGLSNNAAFVQEDYAEKLGEEGLKKLDRIQYLARHMEHLIDNLLSYSHLGRDDLILTRVDLNTVLHKVVPLVNTTLQERNATISINKPLPGILCDRRRITLVFTHLISNAVKYNSKDKKTVEIGHIPKMKTDNGLLQDVFYVRDNGDGIAKEFHDDVFRLFKRLNNEDPTRKGGGVGLTFTRKIIHRHGGQIWLESQAGKGTTFYFTIPQKLAHEAVA